MEKKLVEEGMKKYLKIQGNGDETMSDRMFSYQNIPGFLPVEITWVNGQKQYVYDLSGKVSLESYLSGVGVDQVKAILIQILDLPDHLGDYLLDTNGAVMEGEDIYIDPRTETVYTVYQPDTPYHGMAAIVRLLEFIMKRVNQQNQELMFLIYGLHRQAMEGGATCQILKSYIREYPRQETKKNKEPGGPKNLPGEADDVWQTEREREAENKVTDYWLPGLFLLAGLGIPIVLWYFGIFSLPVSGGTDWTMFAGAAAFFLGTAGYGAWKTWPEKGKTDVKWEADSGKTVCLIPCQGREEPVPITRYPFTVGEDRERADGVLAAREVNAIHARFVREGDTVFVMDEESDAGTYYNDERLVPWQKTPLKDGDLLRFGQGEYVVEITERPYVG